MKNVLLLLLLLSTALLYGQSADNLIGDPERPVKASRFKGINLEGAALRIVLAGADGTVQPLANGQDGQLIQMIGGVPTWVFPVTSQTHTTGATVTVGALVTWLVVDPSATLETLTITLPASPYDGQEVLINFGGTLTEGEIVGAITISPVPIQGSSPENIVAGDHLKYKYKSGINKWYRIMSY